MSTSAGPGNFVYLDGCPENQGSFGLPVRCRRTQETVVLTAAHVVGTIAPGASRTKIARIGAGVTGDCVLGEVTRSHPLSGSSFCDIDAAIIVPQKKFVFHRRVTEVNASGIARNLDEEESTGLIRVHKHGAQSGRTVGHLDPGGASERFNGLLYLDGYMIIAETEDPAPFAQGGDSGSILVDDFNNPVGMVVASYRDRREFQEITDLAYCVPIQPILDLLEIDLIGTGSKSPQLYASAPSGRRRTRR